MATPAAYAPLVELAGVDADVLDAHGLDPLRWEGPPPAVAVNLHGAGPQSHRLLAALRPGRLVAFARPPEHGLGPGSPRFRTDEHEVARWCRLVDQGFAPAAASSRWCDPRDLDLAVPDEPPVVAGAVVVHPGAAHESRRWPAERFAAVAAALAAEGATVVVTGSAAERALAQRVARLAGLPRRRVLARTTSVAGLAATVAFARLVVCGDTGLGHLATAYRRPSVLLFGPVPPARWGPPDRPQHLVLWDPDRGGRGDPWGTAPDPALLAIGVDEVLAAARVLLAGPQPGAAPRAAAS